METLYVLVIMALILFLFWAGFVKRWSIGVKGLYSEKRFESYFDYCKALHFNGKYGVIKGFRWEVKPLYDGVTVGSNSFYLYKKDKDGKMKVGRFGTCGAVGDIPVEFDKIEKFPGYSDLQLVTRDGKQGIYTDSGWRLLEAKYDEITETLRYVFDVVQEDRHGLYEGNRQLIPVKYENVRYPDKVMLNGKWGVYDVETFKLSIPVEYDRVMGERNCCLVFLGKKFGVWDKQKKSLVLPIEYDVFKQVEGYFAVHNGEGFFWFNEQKLEDKFDDIIYAGFGMFLGLKNEEKTEIFFDENLRIRDQGVKEREDAEAAANAEAEAIRAADWAETERVLAEKREHGGSH